MASLYLGRLNPEERAALEQKLHGLQKGNCIICKQPIDLQGHKGQLDIDHVVPLKVGAKDITQDWYGHKKRG
jgi:5-methylcytosine-specific restriction endonuclease McrA